MSYDPASRTATKPPSVIRRGIVVSCRVVRRCNALCFAFPSSDDLEFPRSWLVPILRDHTKNTQLAFFTSYFMPLASTLHQRGTLAEAAAAMLRQNKSPSAFRLTSPSSTFLCVSVS